MIDKMTFHMCFLSDKLTQIITQNIRYGEFPSVFFINDGILSFLYQITDITKSSKCNRKLSHAVKYIV